MRIGDRRDMAALRARGVIRRRSFAGAIDFAERPQRQGQKCHCGNAQSWPKRNARSRSRSGSKIASACSSGRAPDEIRLRTNACMPLTRCATPASGEFGCASTFAQERFRAVPASAPSSPRTIAADPQTIGDGDTLRHVVDPRRRVRGALRRPLSVSGAPWPRAAISALP